MSRVLSQYDYGASVCLLRPVTRASVLASIQALRCRRPGGPGSGAAIVLGESITLGCACVSHRWAGREPRAAGSMLAVKAMRGARERDCCRRPATVYDLGSATYYRRPTYLGWACAWSSFLLQCGLLHSSYDCLLLTAHRCLWTYYVLQGESTLATQGCTTAEHLPLPFTWRYYLEHVFGHPQKLCGTLGNPWHPLNTF